MKDLKEVNHVPRHQAKRTLGDMQVNIYALKFFTIDRGNYTYVFNIQL